MEMTSVAPLSEHEKFILSQMVNSDAKIIEEIGLMYQKQLVEIYHCKPDILKKAYELVEREGR